MHAGHERQGNRLTPTARERSKPARSLIGLAGQLNNYGLAYLHVMDGLAFGFHELDISNQRMKELGRSDVQILAGVMKDEAVDLFREWQERPDHRSY